jgi:hypothetical protein
LYIHLTVYAPGLETPLAAFAIVLFLYKLSQFEKDWHIKPVATRQIVTLSIIATVVMLSRLDLVFLAVIGGIWIIFRGRPIRSLLLLDMLIIFFSMTCSVALRTGIDQYNSTYSASAIEAVILVLIVKITALYFFGAYQHPRTISVLKTMLLTTLAITTSSVLAIGLYLLLVQIGLGKGFPRTAFLIDWSISLGLMLVLRMSAYWFGDQKIKVGTQTITPLVEFQIHWKKWLTEGITYYGILGAALALYMLYNKITFGTSSPVSGQIKRWWGTLIDTVYESPVRNWASFFGISFQASYDTWQPVSSVILWIAKLIYAVYPGANTIDERYYISMFALVFLALIILFTNARRTRRVFTNMALIPLAAGCGIQILSYTTSAYGGVKEWYWISQMVFITLAGSVLLDLLLRPLQQIKAVRFPLELASITLGIILAYQFGIYVKSTMPYNYFPADRPYMEVLPFIEANTEPGDIIGMTGGGNAGYFIHDRTIVNMDGLINSYGYFRALQNGTAPIYLSQHATTIIFANPGLLSLPPYYGQFAPYLENYGEYGGKNFMYLLEKPKY